MIEINFSPRLKSISDSLDENWESGIVEQLPFPIAFHLDHLRKENYPWDFLVKDMLHILLKYLAIVASSDYLHSPNDPDFDINEQLQNLRLNMSEGHWLRLLRTCSTSKNRLVISELKDIFITVEKGPYTAKISWPEVNIRSDNAGILSTLVTIRNKLMGHGKSPSEQDKKILVPQVLGLLRSVLYLYLPIWQYDLVYVFEIKKNSYPYVLRGTTDFRQSDIPQGASPSKCFLSYKDQIVNLYPLVLSDKPRLSSQITLIDLKCEQYILEHIDSRFRPEYIGVSGASYKPADQAAELNHILEQKMVWTKREDVELGDILSKLKEKTLDNLEDIEYNNIYKINSYFHRKDTEDFLNSFIENKESRALIVSGVSGCGKTTSVMHFVNSLLRENKHMLLIRAIELPERVQKPGEFERWMVDYLGYKGVFADVLEYIRSSGSGKLIIILDGINEFTAIGRDASKLFNNINHFLAAYQQSEVLKVIITLRSDTLNFLLPGGKLPVDALDELYFKGKDRDYYEIGTLTQNEGMELLQILKVPADNALNIMNALKENLRTPQVLYKIASGAIAPEDLKGMDSLKITGKFLEKRIGRDKQLKKVCLDLVTLMGKTKDMNLSEEQLTEKSPKLLTLLKHKNNHLLNVLSDLEIIQQIKTEDKLGNPSSAILLSHDTIFEALSHSMEKSTNYIKNLFISIGLILMVVGVVMIQVEKKDTESTRMLAYTQKMDKAISAFDSTLNVIFLNQPGSIRLSTDKEKVNTAYKELFRLYRTSEIEYIKMEEKARPISLYILLAILGIFMVSQKLVTFLLNKYEKREIRIQFFGKNAKLKLVRVLTRFTLIMVLAYIALIIGVQLFVRNDKQAELFSMIAIFIFIILLSVLIPSILVYKTIKMCKESSMINEYFLSKFGRHMIRLEQFLMLSMQSLLTGLIILLFLLPLSFFYPKAEHNELQSRIKKELSAIDVKTIENYPVPSAVPIHEFMSSEGHSLEKKYVQSYLQKFEAVLIDLLDGQKINFQLAQIYLLVLIGITLMTALLNILPFEIAARKYYKKSS